MIKPKPKSPVFGEPQWEVSTMYTSRISFESNKSRMQTLTLCPLLPNLSAITSHHIVWWGFRRTRWTPCQCIYSWSCIKHQWQLRAPYGCQIKMQKYTPEYPMFAECRRRRNMTRGVRSRTWKMQRNRQKIAIHKVELCRAAEWVLNSDALRQWRQSAATK